MLIALSIAISATAIGCYYYLARPVRPKFTQAELDQLAIQAQLDNSSILCKVVDGKLGSGEKEAIQQAFLKGPDFRWMAAGKDMDLLIQQSNSEQQQQQNNNPDTPSQLAQNHKDLVYYMINCMLTFVENYGTIIAAYDAATNDFVGSVSLVPPEYTHRKWLYTAQFLASVIPFGQPVPVQQGPGPAARFQAFDDGYSLLKKKSIVASSTSKSGSDSRPLLPHWTVEVVAVADRAQGRGIGRQLMKLVQQVAKESNTPLYLGCHDENLPFYEKMGFRTAGRHTMIPKGLEDTTSFDFNGMVYAP